MRQMRPSIIPLAILSAALSVCDEPAAGAGAQPVTTSVYISGKDGYHTYRIPALLASSNGTLLAFCEGRKTSRADHGDLDLLVRRSTDRGETWQPMQLVYEEGGDEKVTIGNPCPVVDHETGRIWLPFCRNNADVLVTYSDDDGNSWAPPRDITERVKQPGWGWYATGPGVGIQLRRGPHAGRLVIPCDHRAGPTERAVTHSHVVYSDDHGRTWQRGGTVAPHTNECQVVELAGGRLLINMRNYWERAGGEPLRGGMRAVATSDDGGETWSELRFDKTLIEPVCQASLIRDATAAEDRTRLVFCNPASTTTRDRLTVRLSEDEGRSWPVSRLLHEGPSAYSCLAVLPDGSIGCLYESGADHAYERIAFQRFTLKWLKDAAQGRVSGGSRTISN